jgi:hypothetical protein
MAATVIINEKNGAGATKTDKTSGTIRFKNADNAAVDLNNPMVKPPSGSDWSFEKWLQLEVTGGSYTQITDIVAYTDGTGSAWPGVYLWFAGRDAFATPVQPSALETDYVDAFNFTSGAPLSLGSGPFTGTGDKGKHLVAVMEVLSTVVGGMLSGETLSFAWDEI